MPVPFFDITRQNSDLKDALGAAISNVVNSGRYILGPHVSEFEQEFAAYCGTAYAVGVASGTDALHLALKVCGIKAGDEVITSPFTFVATAEAIVYCGATPVFIDIEPNTFNLDVTKIEEKITSKTKAILPVHLYGLSADMAAVMEIAKKHNLRVIEDCAQAAGAKFDDKKVGGFGDAGCFSFFPTKNLGCFGDGGMITTNSADLYEEIKVLRNHGSRKTYHHNVIGFNSRLDELQAAILRIKLKHLDQFLEHRRQNAAHYRQVLASLSAITLPAEPLNCQHTYNQFTIKAARRETLLEHLKAKGVGAMVYYPIPLQRQEVFAALGYKPGDLPICDKIQNEVLSLPIFPELSQEEINAAASALLEFYKNG